MKKVLLFAFALCMITAYAMEENFQEHLMKAILDNNYELVKECINQGMDLNAANGDTPCATPLNCAALMGNVAIARLLIKNGAKVNIEGAIPDDLLTEVPNPDNFENQEEFARYANAYMSQPIMSSALHYACGKGHADMAIVLIKAGADLNKPNIFGHTPLHTAVGMGQFPMVKVLVENGALVDPPGECLEKTRSTTVWNRAPFTATVGASGSPLRGAIALNDLECATFLIEHGAEINQSHLHVAMISAHRKIARMASRLERKAAMKKVYALVNLLIKAGVSLKEEDGVDEFTLLQVGMDLGSAVDAIWELLLDAGANPYVKNLQGESAIDCAKNKAAFCLEGCTHIMQGFIQPKKPHEWKEFISMQGLLSKSNKKGALFSSFLKYLKGNNPEVYKKCEMLLLLSDYYKKVGLALQNVRPLKYQCINMIRNLVMEGKVSKEDLPNLDEFGFERLKVFQDDALVEERLNNNNNPIEPVKKKKKTKE